MCGGSNAKRAFNSRMLRKTASGVLTLSKYSTYPREYASGFNSPAALLDGLFEHPAKEGGKVRQSFFQGSSHPSPSVTNI
jgi:hypothetical protein